MSNGIKILLSLELTMPHLITEVVLFLVNHLMSCQLIDLLKNNFKNAPILNIWRTLFNNLWNLCI